MKKQAIVVNFLGGPGSGKSTMAAHLFAELKWAGVNCELVTEYAKDKVWAEEFKALENQIYIFGKQQRRIQVLLDKVDVIITDSPLIMGLSYIKEEIQPLKDLIAYEFKKLNNHNFFVKRNKKYNPAGRMQTLAEAIEKDNEIREVLNGHGINFEEVVGVKENVQYVGSLILKILEDKKSEVQI